MAGLKRVVNKKAAIFGSYGWSKGGMAAFQKLVEPLKWDVTDILEFRGGPTSGTVEEGRGVRRAVRRGREDTRGLALPARASGPATFR